LKTTLKRELKAAETNESEAFAVSGYPYLQFLPSAFFLLPRGKKALDRVKLGRGGERHLEEF